MKKLEGCLIISMIALSIMAMWSFFAMTLYGALVHMENVDGAGILYHMWYHPAELSRQNDIRCIIPMNIVIAVVWVISIIIYVCKHKKK
jgi:hypothetical protein